MTNMRVYNGEVIGQIALMDTTNHATLVGRLISTFSGHGSSAATRLVLIVGVTVVVALVVKGAAISSFFRLSF